MDCCFYVLEDVPTARRELELHWLAGMGDSGNIVKIVDVYENKRNGVKRFYLVMECMRGGQLFQRIKEHGHGFTEREASGIMLQACQAVQHLHRINIAHRDIKPENLLFSTVGPDGVLKLADFGFAKKCDSSGTKPLKTPCYTPYYVAPEVLGPEHYDKSCDIWSLGVVMYILLSGVPPFANSRDSSPISPRMKSRIIAGKYEFKSRAWNNVSDAGKSLISGMLKTDPGQRMTIDDVMEHEWICHPPSVPDTPLCTAAVLMDEMDKWSQIQEDMNAKLDAMRTPPPTVLKPLSPDGIGKNKLRERRLSNFKLSEQKSKSEDEKSRTEEEQSKNDEKQAFHEP